jgi:ribosome-associated toxin RatA of RatAB toxin-antitoxin module
MRLRWLLGAFVALTFPTVAGARPTLESWRLDELSHYEVLSFSDPFERGFERGKSIGVIDATSEEVYRVATDYEKYRDYMPRVTCSAVKEAAADHALVQICAELRWPVGLTTVTVRYTHEKLPGDIYRVRFEMVDGEFKQYKGSLYIEPFAPGKTAVTYELAAEPNVLAPKGVVNRGVRRSTGKFVHALRQRVGELHRLGYLHPEPMPPRPGEQPIALPSAAPSPTSFKAHR